MFILVIRSNIGSNEYYYYYYSTILLLTLVLLYTTIEQQFLFHQCFWNLPQNTEHRDDATMHYINLCDASAFRSSFIASTESAINMHPTKISQRIFFVKQKNMSIIDGCILMTNIIPSITKLEPYQQEGIPMHISS